MCCCWERLPARMNLVLFLVALGLCPTPACTVDQASAAPKVAAPAPLEVPVTPGPPEKPRKTEAKQPTAKEHSGKTNILKRKSRQT